MSIGPQPSSVTVFSATVTLTDAEIKALPTTPIAIIDSPGANKVIAFLSAFMVCDQSAGAYINITDFDPTNGNGSISLTISLSDNQIVSSMVSSLDLLSGAGIKLVLVPPILAPGIMTSTTAWIPCGNAQGPALIANKPLAIQAYNSGDFTGGNPANTLKVTVLYTIIDV